MNETPERDAREPGSYPDLAPRPAAGGHAWPAWLALLVAVAALVLAVLGYVGFRDYSRTAAVQLTSFNGNLNAINQRLAALENSTASKSALDAALAGNQQTLTGFGAQLDSFNAALSDLRRRSEQGRDAWIKAEAASLLLAANEQVQLDANPALAQKALAAADERLKLLSDPRLIPVRQQIAREMTALSAVPQADIPGMALTLASLSESVDRLPLKRVAPESYGAVAAASVPDDAHRTLWQRLKASVGRLLHDMFTIQHRDTPIEPLLSPKEEFFLRRNLELRLDAARAALLERDGLAFQNSTRLARTWLMTYFNMQDGGVRAAVDKLANMEQQQIAPPLPDISGSLTLLRRLESPRGKAP